MAITNIKRLKIVKEHVFEVVIEPDEDVYHAYCPVLRGCHTWGHTEAEAFQFIQEAVRLNLEDMIDDGESIPEIGIVDSID
jgi:predicted RNase H-like HicB family nuclease